MTTKILSTQNYDSFKTITGNRTLNKGHVKKLKIAIDANPQITEYNPILVNENMEIIDGQHRKQAIAELGLPVHYIQVPGLTLEDVQALNSNKKSWTPMDYAKAYSINGNENYSFYLVHKAEFGFNHDITVQYAGFPNQNTNASFISGHFKVGKDQDVVFKYSTWLREIKQFLPHAYFRSTALALLDMFKQPEYNHEHMLKRMELHGWQVARHTRKEESIRAIAEYYNKHLKSGKGYIDFLR